MSGAKVLQFPTCDPTNMPAALRWYAQAIEDGRIEAKSVLVVLNHGDRFMPGLLHLGAELNRLEAIGLLTQAQLRVNGVAFQGSGA